MFIFVVLFVILLFALYIRPKQTLKFLGKGVVRYFLAPVFLGIPFVYGIVYFPSILFGWIYSHNLWRDFLEVLITLPITGYGLYLVYFKNWNDKSVRYEGELDDEGYANGYGTETFKDGGNYSGNWKNSNYHGQGTYTYPSGNKYIGDWIDGDEHGQGTFYDVNGTTLEGEFSQGDCIKGKETTNTGDIYVGPFKNDRKHGYGTLQTSDGDVYVGEFKNDLKEGPGKYTYASGNVLEGFWKNNEFVG
jgi:hypothetical protein